MSQAARDAFLRVITNPEVMQIDFWCFGLHVDPAFYGRVIEAANTSRIDFGVDPGRLKDQGAGASYDPKYDLFTFGKAVPSTLWDEIAIIHEATHCGQDIMRFQAPWYCQEAICFVAAAIYRVKRGDRSFDPADTINALPSAVACGLADGGEVPWGPFKDMIDTIKHSPHYTKQLAQYGEGPYRNDGITPIVLRRLVYG